MSEAMLSVLAVVLAVYARKARGAALRWSAAVLLLFGVMIAVVVLLKFGVFAKQIRLLRSYQQPGLARWGKFFLYLPLSDPSLHFPGRGVRARCRDQREGLEVCDH